MLVSRKDKRRQRRAGFASAGYLRLETLEPRQLLSGVSISPGDTATVVSDNSGYYPNGETPGNVLTGVAFNESGCLAGVTPSPGGTISLTNGTIGLFYSDETAMTLGVSQVTTITSSGTTTTDYPVSALPSSPGSVTNPQVGAPYAPPATLGSLPIEAGTDPEGRAMFPSLYVTDITGLDPNSVAAHAGDWQYGGTPVAPSAVYGTWKTVTETIDESGATPKVTFNVAANPAKNNWDLGPGADTPPNVSNQGFGAEVQWDLNSLNLLPGHSYRFYFMVHDGDQNKSGGDVGQAAFDLMQPAAPTITTYASATVGGVVGSAELTDSVTVSGGDNPTGTVTFTVTQPDGTTIPVGSPVTINGDGTYNASTSVLATEVGTYTFHASYSGDANNAAAVDNGQNESVTTVKPPMS
ncbi:MAG TPA: Ig-like domain-containing protein, partial [Pirellulales bacterium]|nr:Ig-like domain-containing protein [Pirellulales bacterium]